MKKIIASYLIALLALFPILGCLKKGDIAIDTDYQGKGKEYAKEHITKVLSSDTVWEGKITVDGVVKVAKDAKLTILPGTVVEFAYNDYDKDGLGDSGILIEGRIFAAGSIDAPVIFTSDENNKKSGAWGMILINFAEEAIFDYCRFEYSTYSLHIHFSTGSITNCEFTENEDGTRIGRSRFYIYNNVFKGNRVKGMNFTDSRNEIKYNTITDNKHGIFLFERDNKSVISFNNINDNNIYNFKLGDFFEGGMSLSDNYWGDITSEHAGQKIYDRKFDDTLGTVSINPSRERISDAGIIREIKITKVFEVATGGYVDSTAAVDEETSTVYFGSYDGFLYAVDARSGVIRFKSGVNDVIDSSPVIYKDGVFFASWNNSVYCLNKKSGALKWEYEMKKSEQDDHRQSSPIIHEGILYIGGYDGRVYAIESDTGNDVWKFKTNGAIRSSGVINGDTIIFGSTDGFLYGLDLKTGKGKWFINLQSPILATPLLMGDLIFVAVRDGVLYGIDPETRGIESKFFNNSQNFYSSPIPYKGDIAFATTSGRLFWLKKYGLGIKGETDIKGPAYATPYIYRDFLLTPTNLGNLNIIERGAAMRVIDYFIADDAIQSTPLAFDGKIYFGSRDNKFYAVKIDVITSDGDLKTSRSEARASPESVTHVMEGVIK